MMGAGKVRFTGVVSSALIAVLGLALHPGCRSRLPEDPESALLKWRGLESSRVLAPLPLAMGGPDCIAPRLQIDPAGITVSLYPSNGILGREVSPSPLAPPPPRSRPRPSAWGQVVVPRPGVCPSVPRRDGRLDGDALASLLRALIASLPRCPPLPVPVPGEPKREPSILDLLPLLDRPPPVVVIAPGDGITWQEIVDVIDTAAKADLTDFRFIEDFDAASCTGAMTPEALREHLAGWRPEDE